MLSFYGIALANSVSTNHITINRTMKPSAMSETQAKNLRLLIYFVLGLLVLFLWQMRGVEYQNTQEKQLASPQQVEASQWQVTSRY